MIKKKTLKELFKILFIIALLLLTFIIFYYIGHYFGYRSHLLTPGFVDNLIKQNNNFVFFYVSWYPLLFLVPLIYGIKENKHFKKYIISSYVCLVITLIIFIVYPTIMEIPFYEINTIGDKILSLLQVVSTPTKCIPSLHVAFSVLFIVSVLTSKKSNNVYKIIIVFFSIGIILSTMFVKQHYFIDVVTGIIVALLSWLISIKFFGKLTFDNSYKKL